MATPTYWICPSCGAWVALLLNECPRCKHVHAGTPLLNNRTSQTEAPAWVRAVSVPTALLGVVAFFLPWVQVSCGPVNVAFSGYEMATGKGEQKVEGGSEVWEHPMLHAAEQQVQEGDQYAGKRLYSDAVEHYQQALRFAPNMAEAHNNLAWLYATSDDPNFRNPPAALKHARRAVELTHWKDMASIDTMAEALYANREFREAVAVETKALQLAPDNGELQEHMTRYRRAAGMAEMPRYSGPPSREPQSRGSNRRVPINSAATDRVPLLWIVPGGCVILVLLAFFGLPRWPAVFISLVPSIYLAYFAVMTEQQLTDPQNTGGVLAHKWMWGFWGCWLGIIAPAIVAWLKPRRST